MNFGNRSRHGISSRGKIATGLSILAASAEACSLGGSSTSSEGIQQAATHIADVAINMSSGSNQEFADFSAFSGRPGERELDYIGPDHNGKTDLIKVFFSGTAGRLKASQVVEIDVIEGNCKPENSASACVSGMEDNLYAPAADYQRENEWAGSGVSYSTTFGEYHILESLDTSSASPSSNTTQVAYTVAGQTLHAFNKIVF